VTADNPIVFLWMTTRAFAKALCSLISSVGFRVAEPPDVNGLEVQRELAGGVAPPIVFITSHGEIPSPVRAMKAGAIEFLSKPFGEQEYCRRSMPPWLRIEQRGGRDRN
jgi:FixJ family two-component response regulator